MAEHRLDVSDVRAASTGSRYRGLLATWTQVKAYFWLRSRTGYALTLRNVSMHFDLSRWVRAMPLLALALALLVGAGTFIFSLIHPAGVVGESRIVVERASGEVFVNVDGRLYPTLNLSSARLIAGALIPATPVTRSALAGYPVGPLVGIPGAPDDMPVSNGDAASAAVCQRTAVNSITAPPVVTVLDGGVQPGGRADRLSDRHAVLASSNGRTYLVWHGAKSVVDVADRVVLAALGIDGEAVSRPLVLSQALSDALPTGLALAEPAVPEFGADSPWPLGSASRIGAVVQVEQPGSDAAFFVVLREGVQQVPQTVAAMIRSRNSFGSNAAPRVPPDMLAAVPRVNIVQIGQYPVDPVELVDPKQHPVLCWWWHKGRAAEAAEAAVLSGTELPISPAGDAQVVEVVSPHDAVTADAVYMGPSAANYVVATGSALTATSREVMWWLSPSGTRFGLDADPRVREGLGLAGSPLPMPWVLLRLFPRGLPPGVALTKADAMTKHDRVGVDPRPGALIPSAG